MPKSKPRIVIKAKKPPSKEEKEFNKQCDKAGGWIDYLVNKNKGGK